jgi:hypothetical protein
MRRQKSESVILPENVDFSRTLTLEMSIFAAFWAENCVFSMISAAAKLGLI